MEVKMTNLVNKLFFAAHIASAKPNIGTDGLRQMNRTIFGNTMTTGQAFDHLMNVERNIQPIYSVAWQYLIAAGMPRNGSGQSVLQFSRDHQISFNLSELMRCEPNRLEFVRTIEQAFPKREVLWRDEENPLLPKVEIDLDASPELVNLIRDLPISDEQGAHFWKSLTHTLRWVVFRLHKWGNHTGDRLDLIPTEDGRENEFPFLFGEPADSIILERIGPIIREKMAESKDPIIRVLLEADQICGIPVQIPAEWVLSTADALSSRCSGPYAIYDYHVQSAGMEWSTIPYGETIRSAGRDNLLYDFVAGAGVPQLQNTSVAESQPVRLVRFKIKDIYK